MAPRDVVCLALPSWEGDYLKSTVELMRRLATRHRVLYVDYAATWKDVARALARRRWRAAARTLGWLPRLRRVAVPGGALHVLTLPPMLPINGLPPGPLWQRLQAWNARRAARAVRQALARLGFEAPVVINALNPCYGAPLAGAFGESRRLYYCYDEIGAAPWNARHGVAAEAATLAVTDLVVTTSDALRSARAQGHPRVVRLANGVDFLAFAIVAGREREPGPVRLGYLGSLDDRVDYALLEAVARLRPEWRLVLVGRVTDERARALGRLPNVELVGPQPPAELPEWVARFDVGLIPFVLNDFTRAIYPLKVNEYLAAGKPVVRTPFADLPEMDAFVAVAGEPLAFVAAVEEELASDSTEALLRRLDHARKCSWEERAAELSSWIDGELPGAGEEGG